LRRLSALAVTLFLAFALAPVALAVTRHVPADYPTIQAAIDAAVDGDTVLVAPGTYVERINFKGKAILVTNSGGASVTTIDGDQKGTVVTFWTSETSASMLSGFTITRGGVNSEAGGISCHESQPTIRDCTISGNSSTRSGGGIKADFGSAPTIENNVITGNSAQQSGGVCLVESPGALIRGNTITGNSAFDNGYGIGGGISCCCFGGGSQAVIESNTIENTIRRTWVGAFGARAPTSR
jgi:parallel beta-helix repeat protein